MTLEEILARARAAYANGVKPARGGLGITIGEDGNFAPLPNCGCCAVGSAMVGLPFTGSAFPEDVLHCSSAAISAMEHGFDSAFPANPDYSYELLAWYRAGRSLAKEVGLS